MQTYFSENYNKNDPTDPLLDPKTRIEEVMETPLLENSKVGAQFLIM